MTPTQYTLAPNPLALSAWEAQHRQRRAIFTDSQWTRHSLEKLVPVAYYCKILYLPHTQFIWVDLQLAVSQNNNDAGWWWSLSLHLLWHLMEESWYKVSAGVTYNIYRGSSMHIHIYTYRYHTLMHVRFASRSDLAQVLQTLVYFQPVQPDHQTERMLFK